jgi:hypothetical protein
MRRIPTPRARDWKDTPGTAPIAVNPDGSKRDRTDRVGVWVYQLEKQESGTCDGILNPEFSEWLMAWPIGWTDLKPLATDKFQQWLRSHGVCSEGQAMSEETA